MDKLNAIPTSPSARNGRGEKVLVINPGSTSTKIGEIEDETHPVQLQQRLPFMKTKLLCWYAISAIQ